VTKYNLLQKGCCLLKMIYAQKRKRLAPSIIGKWIFQFLIFGCVEKLINKWLIFGNTDILDQIKNVKTWYSIVIFKIKKLKKYIYIYIYIYICLLDRQKKKLISFFDRYPKNKIRPILENTHNLNFWWKSTISHWFCLFFLSFFFSLSLFFLCHEHLCPWIISLVCTLLPLV